LNQPDVVLVPVNASQKIKALRNLSRTLNVIAQLAEKTGHSPKIIIVPLGVPIADVQAVLQQIDLQNLNWRLAPAMPNLQDLMQIALYQDRRYIWQYPGYEYLLDYFSNLLTL
jgi:chromosome partitioning protein